MELIDLVDDVTSKWLNELISTKEWRMVELAEYLALCEIEEENPILISTEGVCKPIRTEFFTNVD